ncbi:MAG: M1 family metallopeptidase [Sphingobacteriales bacterium]|nr:M1 family metallopeptidase [Sphingobacteriales bacterium]
MKIHLSCLFKCFITFTIIGGIALNAGAQLNFSKKLYTYQDTLRGSIGEGRKKWNVLHYEIQVEPHIGSQSITGSCIMQIRDSGLTLLQIDLQEPMVLDSIKDQNQRYAFSREGNVYWIQVPSENNTYPFERTFTSFFHGKPKVAIHPPWDGGWIWKTDSLGNPWISIACQGLGASCWFPCKDHQSDEPDSGAILRIIVPDSLTAIANGRLSKKELLAGSRISYTWQVTSPINIYSIVPYIGKYVSRNEVYPGLKGDLSLTYWALAYHQHMAWQQFTQVPQMLKAFEYWFGAYPFYEDGYQLIEAPHLGMEHQSAIAYGNKFKQGYLGTDRSGTGLGLKWDFIIVHESGHEWFGNSLSSYDIADMWIHEGFTTYSEVLFVEYYYGKEAAEAYLTGLWLTIANDIPVIGAYGVNREGSGDMYVKAANMIHYIRLWINDDKKFRAMLLYLTNRYAHSNLSSTIIEKELIRKSGKKLTPLFNQYLRTNKVPILEYQFAGKTFSYKWNNVINGYDVPVKVNFGMGEKWIYPNQKWKKMKLKNGESDQQFKIVEGFYVVQKLITAQ